MPALHGQDWENFLHIATPSDTRPYVQITLTNALDNAPLQTYLHQLAANGIGGVLFALPPNASNTWDIARHAIALAHQAKLGVGLCDFPLTPEETQSWQSTPTVQWTNRAFTSTSNTPAKPPAWQVPAPAQCIATFAVAQNKTTNQIHNVVNLRHLAPPTNGTWQIWHFYSLTNHAPSINPWYAPGATRHVNRWLMQAQAHTGALYGNTLKWYQLDGLGQKHIPWLEELPGAFLKNWGYSLEMYLAQTLRQSTTSTRPPDFTQLHQANATLWRQKFGESVGELVHEAGLDLGIRIDQVPLEPVEVAYFFRRPVLNFAATPRQVIDNQMAAGGARTMGRRFITGLYDLTQAQNLPQNPLLPFNWKPQVDQLFSAGATRIMLQLPPAYPATATTELQTACHYLQRCQSLLQHSTPATELLVWAEAPPAVLAGYSCDYVNLPMLSHARVKQGRIHFASERSYRNLVIACDHLDSPPVLNQIKHLLRQAVPIWILCQTQPPPQEPWPSLQARHANLNFITPATLRRHLGPPTFAWHSDDPGLELVFRHQQLPQYEIYWLNNLSAEAGSVQCEFRATGNHPPLHCDPHADEVQQVVGARHNPATGCVTVSLFIEPHDAFFIVFEH